MNKKFKLDITTQQMKDVGFRYDHNVEDYTYRFPVYKYKKQPIIFCTLGIDEETKEVRFTVKDANDNVYAPFYDREYGVNDIIPLIEKNISSELRKLGAVSK